MESGILAIDQGTTNTKAVFVSRDRRIAGSGSCPVGLELPRPGWFEQNPDEIVASVVMAAQRCLDQVGEASVEAIALSNQRESVVAWHRATGEALGPVLGWQDGRTAEWCWQFGLEAAVLVRKHTGLVLDPMFSAPKLRWLLDRAREAGVADGDIALGTIDSWLVYRFTGRHLIEASNASRTLLFDLRSLDWSDELLELFGIPRACLPQVSRSRADFGAVLPERGLPSGVRITAVLGDSHAALYGHGCHTPGSAKVTYGTGSSVMAPIREIGAMPAEVSTTLAWWIDEPVYAREGNILATGAALDTVARMIGARDVGELTDLASRAESAGGLAVVPAFSGLGAPYWDRRAVGVVTGLARDSSREQLARAALECVAHQVTDVVEAIAASGVELEALHADGGPSRNELLMQLQADLSGRRLVVADVPEVSALGVARLALGEDGWDTPGQDFLPAADAARRHSARATWHAAIARSRMQPPNDPS